MDADVSMRLPAAIGRSTPARIFAGLLLALTLVAPALADWKRDYVLAERAARDGDWVEAERLFRSAARDEPEPSDRKRFEGVVFRDYAPQFWAGIAASRQGSCRRAIDYWQDPSNDAGTLAKIKDFKAQQDRGLSECRQQLAQAEVQPSKPPPTTTPSQTPPKPTPQVVTTPTPTPPRPAPADPKPAPQVVKTPPPPAPTRPAAATSKPAPASLRSAVEAWLSGRTDAVLASRPEQEADGRAKAHLHMLRAAARHLRAELGDNDSLDAAKSDVRAARRAMASISPNEAFFSPSFRTFWQQNR